MKATARNLTRIFDPVVSYQIPLFQRPYVWSKEDNWEPLWEDIKYLLDGHLKDVQDSHVRPHFLGAIVLEQQKNMTGSVDIRQVIDGQQRLTTLQVILIVLRDLCAYKNNDTYQSNFNDLVSNKQSRIDHENERYKVWPTNYDRNSFISIHAAKSLEGVQVEDNLTKAYAYFYDKFKSWLEDETTEHLEDQLKSLWNVLSSFLLVVVIDLEEDDEPQVIFETLNARGTPLLPADLMKNYLFHKAEKQGENIENLYNDWKPFDKEFWREEVKLGRIKRPRIDLFMQNYLTLKTLGDVKVGHIFSIFKAFEENTDKYELDKNAPTLPKTASEHIQSLKHYGEVFQTFYKPEAGSRTALFLNRLVAVDTVTVYPFLLEAFNFLAKKDADELEQIMVTLESYLMRRMICCLSAKNYNRFFLDLTRHVQNEGHISNDSVVSFLTKAKGESSKFPNDEEFKKAWLEFPLYNSLAQYKVRAILLALDKAFQESKSEEIVLPDNLTIEHLLPNGWETHWPLVLDDENDVVEKMEKTEKRNILLHTLGNLSLITGVLNPSISNGPWHKKKPEIIKFSKLNLNRYFHDKEYWDEEAIKLRGKCLFDEAKKLWPHPTV